MTICKHSSTSSKLNGKQKYITFVAESVVFASCYFTYLINLLTQKKLILLTAAIPTSSLQIEERPHECSDYRDHCQQCLQTHDCNCQYRCDGFRIRIRRNLTLSPKSEIRLDSHVRTAHTSMRVWLSVLMTVFNCGTQHSTEQFWTVLRLILQTLNHHSSGFWFVTTVQMLSTGQIIQVTNHLPRQAVATALASDV